MTDSRDATSNSSDDGQLSPDLIAAVAGVVDVPVFAYLGLLLFDDLAFGAVVGVLVGLGTYLFLPAAIADDEDRGPDETPPVDATHPLRGFHRTAAGLALPPTGILLFAWRLVSDALLVGVLATLVVVAVIYVSLAVLLPPRLA
ncbi:hypothetical protein [Natrinema salinisoli]|uniref:hypothetical protein n=1 Tax=Natrinema salinisoli TaxID=2878535 RepID=UPI001CF02CF3|nr:hypothetical protein [Natrinema salinisoli]